MKRQLSPQERATLRRAKTAANERWGLGGLIKHHSLPKLITLRRPKPETPNGSG